MIAISPAMRVAVTGSTGRLGSAMIYALGQAGVRVASWGRPDYDLDDPQAASRMVARDRPDLVVHCAAWVNVDGCARDPDLAFRRNAEATHELAAACSRSNTHLLLVSTNEVFDGRRDDGCGYTEEDPPKPPNSYGASKLHGELAASAAFEGADAGLWVVRTAWLFGPKGNDFPSKVLAAADLLDEGAPLRMVVDEFGNPTHIPDLAEALIKLVTSAPPATYHLASEPAVSRYEWALRVLAAARRDVRLEPISRLEFERASQPPPWGVLDCSAAASLGVSLPSWARMFPARAGDRVQTQPGGR